MVFLQLKTNIFVHSRFCLLNLFLARHGDKRAGERKRNLRAGREREGGRGREIERGRKREKGREIERKGEKERERERKGEKGRERERKGSREVGKDDIKDCCHFQDNKLSWCQLQAVITNTKVGGCCHRPNINYLGVNFRL